MPELDAVRNEFTPYEEKLRALRDNLVVRLEDAPASTVAPLTKELREVLAKLEDLAPTRRDSAVDDLSKARENRRSKAGL